MDTLNKAQSLRDRVQASGITRVPVTIRPSQSRYDRYWILQIDRCPFCHRPHVHGGGNLDGPPALGPRGRVHSATVPIGSAESAAD